MNSVLITILSGFLLAAPHSPDAKPKYWNQFRGPLGNGHATAKNLPVKFSETEYVIWKTPLEGKAWSSPVVWENQIWVTNAFEDGKKLYAVCIDLQSGEIIKNLLVFENDDPQFCHPMNSYATPTPVIEDGHLYVHFGVYGTACLDTKSGKILWSRRDLKCDHFRGPASSPILDGNKLIAHFDGHDVQYVVALDKRNGKTIWKSPRAFDYKTNNGDRKKAYCTPSVISWGKKRQLICPAAVATEAFDPETGTLLWTVYHGGMNASARPLFGDGLLFITNGMGGMIAVKPGTKGDITKTNIVWESRKNVAKKSSPILVEDLLFMVDDSGVATCRDPQTGEIYWTKRLKGEFAASPVFVDGRIYLFSREGRITAIKPAREYEILGESELESGFMASPAIVDDSFILRTKSHLYRIGKVKEKPKSKR